MQQCRSKSFVLRWLPLFFLFIAGLASCTDDTPEASTPTLSSATAAPVSAGTSADLAKSDISAEPLSLDNTVAINPTPTLAPPTAIPTNAPTPIAGERLQLAGQLMIHGDYAQAATQFEAVLQSDSANINSSTLLQLGIAYWEDGNSSSALDVFTRVTESDPNLADGWYFSAEAHRDLGDCPSALNAYELFLAAEPSMRAYVAPKMAVCQNSLGNFDAMSILLQTASEAPSHYLTTYQNRVQYAQQLAIEKRYAESAAVYLKIRDAAFTEVTQAQMSLYAGQMTGLAGDEAAQIELYQGMLTGYPDQYASYEALIELVENEEDVDPYWRGVVDYTGAAYTPCVNVLKPYISESATFEPDALLYLAWCYEGLSDVPNAVAAFDAYAAIDAANTGRALVEKGRFFWRVGLYQEAVAAYQNLVDVLPADPFSAESAYSAAQVTDFHINDDETAVELYEAYAASYPFDENAAQALYRAGWLAERDGAGETAQRLWTDAVEKYPNIRYGQASLVSLLAANENAAAVELAQSFERFPSYYNIRVQDIVAQQAPFTPPASIDLEPATSREARLSAETYLQNIVGLGTGVDISSLPIFVREDGHFKRGATLWRLREFEAAKREFEFLRGEHSSDLLVSYQLALYFRQIGLYRSSILAATTVINLTDDNVFTVPPFLASLAYPVYYSDLILPLADEYGYDPLVQFALVRQESLYESFATSSAVAQGLAQVIPDTGTYISDKLQWPPNYRNRDLYKPYVGLRFGGFYLAEQLTLFDNTVHSALAAYNGGPGNALRWYDAAGKDIDAYFETVNFPESRLYIERIYVGHAVYKHLYGERLQDDG